MKKIVSVIIIVTSLLVVFYIIGTRKRTVPNQKTVDTVFVGPKEYHESFESSAGSAKLFYEKYRLALDNLETKNFPEAIRLFNECIPDAGLGIEKGMVYNRLAQIYKELNDLRSELIYTELTIKFSANKVLNEERAHRVAQLRQLLAASATKASADPSSGGKKGLDE